MYQSYIGNSGYKDRSLNAFPVYDKNFQTPLNIESNSMTSPLQSALISKRLSSIHSVEAMEKLDQEVPMYRPDGGWNNSLEFANRDNPYRQQRMVQNDLFNLHDNIVNTRRLIPSTASTNAEAMADRKLGGLNGEMNYSKSKFDENTIPVPETRDDYVADTMDVN